MSPQHASETLAISGGSPVRKRPFPLWPQWGEEEKAQLLEVLESRNWGGYHPKVREFEERWAAYCGTAEGVLAVNGTVTLVACLLALGIKPEDEVIVPAVTFVATASAVSLVGAVPVFVDIDPATLNLDPDRIEAAITPRTRAVIVVHFGGQPADLDRVQEIARDHNLKVIEDAAHAHGSEWKGRRVGSFGDLASFSFQNTKALPSGEGGIVVGNASSPLDFVRSYVNQGRRPDRGWYEHFILGTNARISGFQAGILLAQLARLDDQIATRTRNAALLSAELKSIPGVMVPDVRSEVTRHSFYILPLRLRPNELGTSMRVMVSAVEAEGIPVSAYPYPLYRNEVFQKVPTRVADCPEAEKAALEVAWLQGYALLGDEEDIADVAAAFRKVAEQKRDLPPSVQIQRQR